MHRPRKDSYAAAGDGPGSLWFTGKGLSPLCVRKHNQETCMNFSDLFDGAATAAFEELRKGEFIVESKTDIQALLFHHAALLARSHGLPLKVHVEPIRLALKPDLVFGDEEVFVEVRHIKAGAYAEALQKWRGDVWKLHRYKSNWPQARCVFLAIDQGGHPSLSEPTDFFDPTTEKLKGAWAPLGEASRFLLAEL